MSTRSAWTAVTIMVAALAIVAAATMWPQGADGYRTTLNQAAQETLSAVRTAAVLARSDGRVSGPYATVVLDQARTAVAGSQQELAGTEVPDAPSAELRSQLVPLLDRAAQLLSSEDGALAAAQPLDELGDRLQAFVAATR